MKYNFDKIINRHNSNSIKYDSACKFNLPNDIQPMWIADMDFETAPCIVDCIQNIAKQGVFGYSYSGDSYYNAVQNWFLNRFDFGIEKDWIVLTPGVVFALNMAVKAFTKKGDAIMIQSPVYAPFSKAINNNGRKLVNNPLTYKNGRYTMDFTDMEAKIKAENVKMLILCSPHNPIGRVWTKDELLKLLEICLSNNVLVVSDEIHCDFVFSGRHTVFASLNEKALNNCIVCTSPSKTFNIAGLQASNIIIPNLKLKEKFLAEKTKAGYGDLNIFAIKACEVAYNKGGDWLSELLVYVENNYKLVKNFIAEKMPDVKVVQSEGTFLAWLDFSKLGIEHSKLNDKLLNDAKVWLDEGIIFGDEGRNFMRLNIACPKSQLIKALEKMHTTLYK